MDDKVLGSGPIPLRDLMSELYERSKLSTNHPLPTNAFCGSMRQIRDKLPLFVEWRNTREVLISSSLFSANDWRWTIDRTDCSDSCYSFKFSGVGKKMCRCFHIFCYVYFFLQLNIWFWNTPHCFYTETWRMYEWMYLMFSLGIQCFANLDSSTAPLWKSKHFCIRLKRILITL